MFSALLFCSLAFAESKSIAVQISLDRLGYSCNAIDGLWGTKSAAALSSYCADRGIPLPKTPDDAYDRYFSDEPRPRFRLVTVSRADLDALVPDVKTPAEKARLPRLGYTSIAELMAERGHMGRKAFERMNPGIDWQSVPAGLHLVVPDFPETDRMLDVQRRPDPSERSGEAVLVRVSLSRFEISAYDRNGRRLALFPCSIARDKTKVPQGKLRIVSRIPHPNYTYTPKDTSKSRLILPEGPNCPVGVVWMGLNIPGYGIHGTPTPETIGSAESHGCFRLANWNAARLFSLVRIGTEVIVDR